MVAHQKAAPRNRASQMNFGFENTQHSLTAGLQPPRSGSRRARGRAYQHRGYESCSSPSEFIPQPNQPASEPKWMPYWSAHELRNRFRTGEGNVATSRSVNKSIVLNSLSSAGGPQ